MQRALVLYSASLFALSASFSDLSHMLAILRNFGASSAADLRHMLAILCHLGATTLADFSHMIAILRDLAASLATGFSMPFRVAVPSASGPMLAAALGVLTRPSPDRLGRRTCCSSCHCVSSPDRLPSVPVGQWRTLAFIPVFVRAAQDLSTERIKSWQIP